MKNKILVLIAVLNTSLALASQDEEKLRRFKQESEDSARVASSKIGGNFINMENNPLKDYIGYEGTNVPGMHMPLEQAEGEGKKKREKVYATAEEYICTKQECEAGHSLSTKATLERETRKEEVGFIRDGDKMVRNNKGYLDKALKTVKDADKGFDFLTGKYTDCKPDIENGEVKKEETCDQYYEMKENMCFPKQVVEIDPKYTYLCNKKREVREKTCSDVVKGLKCAETGNCDAKGIVKNSISIENVQWVYSYPRITLGTINIFANPHNCEKRTAIIKFEIKNKHLIETFRLVHADYSDWLRITVNGTQLVNTMGGNDSFFIEDSAYNEYQKRKEQKEKEIERQKQSHGVVSDISLNQLKNINSLIKARENQGSAQGTFGHEHDFVRSGTARTRCNTKRFYNLPLNVDVRPYLKEGENEMVVELVFGNRGQLHLYMDTQQHCCIKWVEEREETCTFSS